MDIDFHYHATFAAARFAGYTAAEATTIATSAQMIDENARHVLVKKTGVASGFFGVRDDFELREVPLGSSVHTYRVQMTFQGLGDIGSSAGGTLASIWPVYHFLPGNFLPESVRATTRTTLEDVGREGPGALASPLWRRRELKGGTDGDVQAKFRWVCRPHSPMAIGLVNNCTDLVHDTTSQVHKQNFKLHMVGVTMHVFIDTWAHQDFVGPASKGINGRSGKPSIAFAASDSYRTFPATKTADVGSPSYNLGTKLVESEWKGTAPGAPSWESGVLYVGHGQVGHWPDHSALIWQYQPAWSASPILRINPVHYFDAFVHMVFAMMCIRNNRQYTPFEVNERSLAKLYSLSAAAAGPAALTAPRLKTINRLIQKERDPWGTKQDPELPPEISDDWDKAIFLFGREWQQAFEQELFPDEESTTDWVPGASDWVHEALGAFRENKAMSSIGSADWLTVGQFQSMDFFKFNLAAKFHYRFVKQQLLTFNEMLLGSWADGAAYADDFQRIENLPNVRLLAPWKIKVLDVLGKRQRESKHREVSEGMTILMSELEGAGNAKEAVQILRRAINPDTGGSETWTYGMETTSKGVLKHGKTYEAISDLIKQMEALNGFADMSTYLPLPTVGEWEKRSSVMLSRRASDTRLTAIDKALKATHKALDTEGLSNREASWANAKDVVTCCQEWLSQPGREKRRDSATAWLLRATQDWLKSDRTAHGPG